MRRTSRSGISGRSGRIRTFYINSDGKLVIAFDEAEVAPASMGCPEFVIPTEVIQDMLNPGLALIQ